jgi:microsomal dipeptidase-like Zn-dependent dipeptidase/gamma-glutamyl-gamma-aminobutyrate hydrolase PuuD
MKSFNIQSYLDDVYASYPEAEHRPIIGITANYSDGKAMIMDRYYTQVVEAGGVPMLLPPTDDVDVIINSLANIDGLLLSGGADYNPLWAGEDPEVKLGGINSKRDKYELLITRLAFNRQIPMLGICRGIQTMAMALDGKVKQDISADATIKHSQDAERNEPTHLVMFDDDSILAKLYPGTSGIYVNSFHHQAVAEAGPHFRVVATSMDDIIEAIESSEHKPMMGVQWHPEWLEEGLPLFKWLVGEAAIFNKAKKLHKSIVTLDTHCDTPMFFPQGIDFAKRDDRILYDLHKWTEGRTDAVTMVAYLPQPKDDERFTDIAPFEVDGPKAYADLIFDKLDDIISSNSDYIGQAFCRYSLLCNKYEGKKSILYGIENGLAIEDNLDNVNHFAERGVTYITLCHNGDNQICDSARRSNNTNNGVSEFGAKVIERMNDCGIMVDLSHAGEKSFYDALEISRTPIVCSHSNCRALCDVPRNLTDDQLRALAKAGGVAHITLYHGFLVKDSKEGEATILDAIDHLNHAIDIMGIDHVGLGTDFDGDGTVRGCADASELINFTMTLLRKRYSVDDITKIWGGNWLYLMEKVQSMRK